MKTVALVLSAVLAGSPAFAFAQDKAPSAAQKRQQERMRDCNEQAAERKGEERRKFMSSCLRAGTTAKGEKMTAQQARMRDCNRQAGGKGLKGDERKQFMSSCLKG